MVAVPKYIETITLQQVEHAWGQAYKARDAGRHTFAQTGLRAAQAGDHRLLMTLEKGANLISQHDEATRGQTRRSAENHNESVETTDTQMWRAAYESCDRGTPIEELMWVYGAAAYMCGYVL